MIDAANANTTARPETGTGFDFSHFMAATWLPLFGAPMQLMAHWMRFAAHRMTSNADYVEALINCRTPADLAQRNVLYAEQTAIDFQDAVREVTSEVDVVHPLQRAA